jgi:hypothetical protein
VAGESTDKNFNDDSQKKFLTATTETCIKWRNKFMHCDGKNIPISKYNTVTANVYMTYKVTMAQWSTKNINLGWCPCYKNKQHKEILNIACF